MKCSQSTHVVLVELAHERAGDEVVAVHGHDQGAAVRRVEQRSHGLQQPPCDPAGCDSTGRDPTGCGPTGCGPTGCAPTGCAPTLWHSPLADVGQLLPQ